MCGVPGLAVSLCVDFNTFGEDYMPTARLAARVAEWMISHPLPRGCVYNLNVPNLPCDEIRGLVPARLAPVFLSEALYRQTEDGYHYVYTPDPEWDPDSDMARIEAGYATITKLTWDMRLEADDRELWDIGL